ncbi:MAG: hypothetical protein GXP43_02805 [bacterium]|nr:hypothetical protein [bacterium]
MRWKAYLNYFKRIIINSFSLKSEFRANLFFDWLGDGLFVVVYMIFWSVIFGQVDNLNGWSKYHLYLILATYDFIEAIKWSFFYEAMQDIARKIYRGELDSYLTKPLHPAITLSFTEIDLFGQAGVLGVGSLLFYYSVSQLGWHWWQIAAYFAFLIVSAVIIFAFRLFLSSISFYIEGLEGFVWFDQEIQRMMRMPLSFYPKAVKFVLLLIIPMGAAMLIPARVFRLDPVSTIKLFGLHLGIAVVWLIFGFWFFNRSLHRYTSMG